MQCDYHCVGCYLKKDITEGTVEKDPKFFEDLIRVAKKVGMTELAVPMNWSKETGIGKDKSYEYFLLFSEACRKHGLEMTMTCNYDFFVSYPDIDLSGVSLISVSINDFVTGTPAKRKEALDVLKSLRDKGHTYGNGQSQIINCNVLLSDRMVDLLEKGVAKEILDVSDSMYLVTSKPLTGDLMKVGEWMSRLAETLPLDSERVIMDSCVKYAFGLTDGTCDRHQMIYVNPYGEIKMCSFDSKNLVVLNEADDFEDVYNNKFPLNFQSKCSLMGM